MADRAHEQTDEILTAMEQRLSAIYSRAARETGIAWKEYLKESTAEIEELQKIYDEAKKSGDQTEIRKTGINLSRAKREQTIQNKRFKDLSAQTAEEISHINETALAYINGRLPEVYSLNYNALDGQISGYSFTLTDASTVKSLAESDKNLLPYKHINGKKDVRWNVQKINSEVLQGILQGESMDKIAARFSNVMKMDEVSAIRNARTTVTSAECKGRQDSYKKAEEDGIIMKKKWISTNDGRTRHSHILLNGKTADVDEPFHSILGDIMYPGDSSATPANVYNCRCTLAAKVIGFAKRTVEKVKESSWVSSFAELPPKMEFYTKYEDYKNDVEKFVSKYGKEEYEKLSELAEKHDSVWFFGFGEEKESKKEKALRFDNTISALQSKYKLPKNNKLIIGDYDNVKSFLNKIQRERASGDCAGQAWLNPESNNYIIGYNISYGKTFKEDLQTRIKKIKSGDILLSVFENDSPEGIAIHEFGHHMSDYITNGMIHDSQNSKDYWEWYKSLSKEEIKNGISSYATTNRGEFEAECFAELQTDNPRPLAIKYGKFLKKAIEENWDVE